MALNPPYMMWHFGPIDTYVCGLSAGRIPLPFIYFFLITFLKLLLSLHEYNILQGSSLKFYLQLKYKNYGILGTILARETTVV